MATITAMKTTRRPTKRGTNDVTGWTNGLQHDGHRCCMPENVSTQGCKDEQDNTK